MALGKQFTPNPSFLMARLGGWDVHSHACPCFPMSCAARSVDPNDQKKTACYDIDVEVDDPLKAQMSNFLASTTNQQEIASLDVKVSPLGQATVRVSCLSLSPSTLA